ncbi:transposase [Streptomyces sp. S1]|uniref:transposase n=1 Tax=Streptomyces sp. S1 TaxID=718288 RepID=UPI003D718328
MSGITTPTTRGPATSPSPLTYLFHPPAQDGKRFSVRSWLADHADEIELHFLPSYSPELNPDELVNADLKCSLPHATMPGTRTNSPLKPVGSSAADKVSPTSSPLTSKPRTPAISSTSKSYEFLINRRRNRNSFPSID